jgi:hypothetical protein
MNSGNTNILSFKDYIKNKFNNYAGKRAVRAIEQILQRTGHVPSVTTIARGAGFCTYHARLVEGIGVKPIQGHIVDRASGKGDDIHKILGLASLRLFTDFDYANIGFIVRSASNELKRYSLLQDINEEQNIQTASKLLSNLINKLSLFEDILEIKVRDTYPIVEQQLIDYDLRMRGIPDLILEHKKEEKAIVIDWKTNRETPNDYESAQVICYALLEAKRLGYEKEDAIRSICGELKENRITSINILPIIIRPDEKLALKPHPIFSSDEIRERYEKFERFIRNVIIMAEHLTVLISNQERLTGVKRGDTTGSIGQKKYNYVRLTPFDLGLPRGNPNNQDKYPCNVCYLKGPCSFYFGHDSGTDDEEYNRKMWRLRFIVFDEKEEQLLPYLAIYKIFNDWSYDDVISNLKAGKGFRYTLGFNPAHDDKIPSSIIISRSEISTNGRINMREIRKRIDIIDNITTRVSNNLSLILEATRPIRNYEYERAITYIINEGKTVLITIPYPRKDINPLLSINFFGKIDEVSIDNNIVSYTISLPSKVLRYQTLVFTKYLANNNFKDLIMVEIDVDLTRLELNAIDYLHRIINEDTEYTSSEEKDEKEKEQKEIEDSRSAGIDTDEGKEFEEFLKEIIGHTRGSDKDGIQN